MSKLPIRCPSVPSLVGEGVPDPELIADDTPENVVYYALSSSSSAFAYNEGGLLELTVWKR